MKRRLIIVIFVLSVAFVQVNVSRSEPAGTSFTYQGKLMETGDPADGLHDFQFRLFSSPSATIQEGATIEIDDLNVSGGTFTAQLDFGSNVFNGDARWLEISVRPGDGSIDYTTLDPRQRITASPYSLQTRGIFVSDSGNVGIKTTSPNVPLEVHNDVSGEILRLESDTNYGYMQFREGASQRAFLGFGDNGSLLSNALYNSFAIDGLSTALHFAVDSDATKGITVDTDGHVGIGTTIPSGLLELSALQPRLYFNRRNSTGNHSGLYWRSTNDDYEGAFIRNNSTGDFGLYTNHSVGGLPKLFIENTGNVGIGTMEPAKRLEVVSSGYEDGMQVTGSTGKELFRVRENSDGSGSIYSNNLYLTGAYFGNLGPDGGAPFPRPAYDSGRVLINQAQRITLNHGVGGNPDNYFVDIWFYGPSVGRNNIGHGGDIVDSRGIFWDHLTNTQVEVYRDSEEVNNKEFRLRIWLYN